MSASINVSLISAASGKAEQVMLPRSMTVAELYALAGKKNVSFAVDGCTPAASTTLGDLYDMCAKQEVLEVKFSKPIRFGNMCYGPCCCYNSGSPQDPMPVSNPVSGFPLGNDSGNSNTLGGVTDTGAGAGAGAGAGMGGLNADDLAGLLGQR